MAVGFAKWGVEMLIDQLRIGSKKSYDDFEASVKERKIGFPEKKTVKDTVPFSNVTYDFSKINGELYWGERKLEYIFEIDADTPEELEQKKIAFNTWIMNVFDEELHDPFIEDYHFNATFDSIDFDDSEVEKTTITVTFSAYPFMIANTKKVYTFTFPTGSAATFKIENKSSHKITPILIASGPVTFDYGGKTYSINAGEYSSSSFKLETGLSDFIIQPASTGGTLRIEFFGEVF